MSPRVWLIWLSSLLTVVNRITGSSSSSTSSFFVKAEAGAAIAMVIDLLGKKWIAFVGEVQ